MARALLEASGAAALDEGRRLVLRGAVELASGQFEEAASIGAAAGRARGGPAA